MNWHLMLEMLKHCPTLQTFVPNFFLLKGILARFGIIQSMVLNAFLHS